METQTKIDTLTTREVNLPKVEGLQQFVKAWTEIAKEGEYPGLVTEALVKTLSKAYYKQYWPVNSPGEKWVSYEYYEKSWASEYYNKINLELEQAKTLPFWKRKPEVSRLEEKLANAKDKANQARTSLKETIAVYRRYQFPYKVAVQELSKQVEIPLEKVYEEMKGREHHFPI